MHRAAEEERAVFPDSIDKSNADEVADHTEPNTHATPPLTGRTAMDRVAGLAHVACGKPVGNLEQDAHGDHGRCMAFVADVRLDPNQHVRPALVAGVAVEAGDLLRLPLERHVRKERVLVVGIDGLPAEELLVVVALSAEGVHFGPGHLRHARRPADRVTRMGRQVRMAGPAFVQFRNGDLRHAMAVGMACPFPRVELLLVAGLADGRRR